jgi:integrase
LAPYAERWLRTYADVHLRETTAKNYRSLLAHHVLPTLGAKTLDAISREDIKAVIATMHHKGLSRSTVANTLAPLREMLTHAVEDGKLTVNPAARMGRFVRRDRDPRAAIQPLTRVEVETLLTAAQQHTPRTYPVLLCAVRTGLRLGELLGLQWGDLDFHGRFLEVRCAIVRGRVVPTKSGKIRRVDLSPQLADTLQALLVQRKAETLCHGWGEVPEWVFVNEAGERLKETTLRKYGFYRCLEKAGLRRVRFHDLRHTFASLLIPANESPKKIQALMGHHSIQITMDIYGHLYAEEGRRAVDALDAPTTERNPGATTRACIPSEARQRLSRKGLRGLPGPSAADNESAAVAGGMSR